MPRQDAATVVPPPAQPELAMLFHRLNNQLSIILAHAELLEARAGDEQHRGRAAQVVSSVLDAMRTARDLQRRALTDSAQS